MVDGRIVGRFPVPGVRFTCCMGHFLLEACAQGGEYLSGPMGLRFVSASGQLERPPGMNHRTPVCELLPLRMPHSQKVSVALRADRFALALRSDGAR